MKGGLAMPKLRESPQQAFYTGLTKKIKTQMIQQGYVLFGKLNTASSVTLK